MRSRPNRGRFAYTFVQQLPEVEGDAHTTQHNAHATKFPFYTVKNAKLTTRPWLEAWTRFQALGRSKQYAHWEISASKEVLV